MKHLALPVIIFTLVFSTSSFAEKTHQIKDTLTVEEIQKLDQIQKAYEALDKLKMLSEKITRRKYSDCIKTYGDKMFCQCLSDNLPVPVSLMYYTEIVTTPKNELGYEYLDSENKEILDTTLRVRNVCVEAYQ